ncbi:MAG: TIGR03790 family protein, partial [Verrucomicrobiota bacterium]
MQFPAKLFFMLAMTVAATNVWAGGSGFNVIVVVNQNSSNSVQLGNDYCEQRGVPPQNLFRMTGWTGGSITWSLSDFQTYLLNPMLAMLASRGLTNQAEFVLLSMDVPYRVEDSGSQNSTTSALFYGFKYDGAAPGPGLPTSCSIPDTSSNSYVFSELPFGDVQPSAAYTNSLLAMMLTDVSLSSAESILSRGVASDASYPTQAVYLAKTDDVARNVRFVEFDNAIFDSRIAGDTSLVYLSTDSTSFTNLLGLLTGLGNYSLPANAFVPGAISDTLTSYAGYILEDSGQTPLLAFLDAGAAASYGTVVEPCNYT